MEAERTPPVGTNSPLGGHSPLGGLTAFLNHLERGVCYAAFLFLTLMPAGEVIARLLGTGIPSSSTLINQFLLVAALMAGMYTARTDEHLSIALVHFIKDRRIKTFLAFITGAVSVFVLTLVFWYTLSFYKNGITPEVFGFIPAHLFALVMPVGFGVMIFRFARQVPARGAARLIPAAAFLLGTFCALPAFCRLLWGLNPPPEALERIIEVFAAVVEDSQGLLVVLLLLAALLGTPLFVVIGGIALVVLEASGGQSEAVPIQIYTALTNSDIVAIPLFTVTGFFLSESKAGERLVQTFHCLFNWLPGGMIIATVIICAFFTSFTGASGVTILALGGVLYTILSEKSTYPAKFSIGLLTSAGGIGLLFPPSLPIILVGVTTMTNIIQVFLGAFIPGLILVLAMIAFGIAASIRIKIPVERFDVRKAGRAIKESIFEILLPIFLIVGYFSGVLSLIEMGAVSVIYVFIVEVLIHRDIPLSQVPTVFFKSIPIIGGVLSILAMAKALSYGIVFTQVPDLLAEWLLSAVESRWLFLLLLNLALLVVGCLMDIFSAILVILPLIVPLGEAYGIDPVHLGVIFIINLEVGFLTPPVGLNLFLATYRFKRPFPEICRYVLPFLLIQLLVVFLVTYIPWFSTWLPGIVNF